MMTSSGTSTSGGASDDRARDRVPGRPAGAAGDRCAPALALRPDHRVHRAEDRRGEVYPPMDRGARRAGAPDPGPAYHPDDGGRDAGARHRAVADLMTEFWTRLREEGLWQALWSLLPDRCEVPGCSRQGIRGNENVINGRITCDYCGVAAKEEE